MITTKMGLKTSTALLGSMSPVERRLGRYMRAPDGHGEGGGGGSSDSDSSAGGTDGGEGELSTEAQLDKEFGGGDAPDSGDGGDDDEEDGEDRGSHHDDDQEDGDDGDGEPEDDGESDGEEGQEDGRPPKNRTEERIAELKAQTREAERKAAEATREADKWRRIAEGAPAAPEPVADGEEDPNAEPDPANFEFGAADPEYIAAKAEWSALNRLRKEGAEAGIKAELNRLEAKYQTAIPAALEKYPDYDTVVIKGAEGDNPTWACPPIISLGIRDSDVGTDIAYHLASNPEESRRIASLSNLEQAREFGRLEGRFMNAEGKPKDDKPGKEAGKPATKPTPKKHTSAPTPPKRNIARGAGGKFEVPPDTDDFAAFDRTYGNGPKK